MWIADNTLLIKIKPLDLIIIKVKSKKEKQEEINKIKRQHHKKYKSLLKGEYTGSTDDLIYYIKHHKCFMRSLTLMKVKGFIDAGEFAATYRMLNNYVENNRITSSYMDECDEIIYYLYTYSYSKIMNFENTDDLFQFEHLLLEILSYFPNSNYKVFVYAYLGKIKTALKQYAEAEAYFRIILNNHIQYIGTPEILQKYSYVKYKKNQNQEVIKILRELINTYPDNKISEKGRLELGKALYKEGIFSKAIKNIEIFLTAKPDQVYKDSELLWILGDSYFKLKKYDKAKETLTKAYNFFFETKEASVLLNRIGDIYRDSNKAKEAIDVYKLVIKRYPDLDSAIDSALSLAELVQNHKEKEEILTSVIKRHPQHRFAKRVLMELAVMQNKAGEYTLAVDTIKKLLSMKTGALKQKVFRIAFDTTKGYFKIGRYGSCSIFYIA